jgi:hypothetical protein
MTITKNYSDSNGGDFQRATGRFLNDDTAVAIAIELGFRPRYFQLVNLTDRITHEWYEGMASGTTVKTAADGVRTLNTADVAIQVDAGSGSQDGSQGAVDATNAGVRNNVAYPGPATVIDSTATDIPGVKPAHGVTIAAAAAIEDKQYTWLALG